MDMCPAMGEGKSLSLERAGGNPSGLDERYPHEISPVWIPENKLCCMFCGAVEGQGLEIGLTTSERLPECEARRGM